MACFPSFETGVYVSKIACVLTVLLSRLSVIVHGLPCSPSAVGSVASPHGRPAEHAVGRGCGSEVAACQTVPPCRMRHAMTRHFGLQQRAVVRSGRNGRRQWAHRRGSKFGVTDALREWLWLAQRPCDMGGDPPSKPDTLPRRLES